MKIHEIETNYNNKMACSYFVHISTAPDGIPERLMGQLYKMITRDSSHPPVTVRLVSLTRMNLHQAYDCFTMPSHGMSREEFIPWFMHKHPKADEDYPLAVYYYSVVER